MATAFPDDFKCPISLEIMSDPVILSSGHTFDRSSIQRWLDSGHRTCPITKLPLSEPPSLIPNHALRSLISHFTLVSLPKPHSYPQPQTLISTLTSPSSPLHSKLSSLDQLTRLSKRDSALRRRLTESGAVSAVLNCVDSDDPTLQEKAMNLLLNLSLDDDNKVGLVAEGAIGRVIAAMRGGGSSPDCRAVAATILTSLAVVEVNKATIGAYPYAIRALVSLLRDGNAREVKEAATALYAICSYPDNGRRAVDCGVIPILISIAGSGLERAVEVLGLLAKCKEGREEMVKFNGCIQILVRVLRNGSSRGGPYFIKNQKVYLFRTSKTTLKLRPSSPISCNIRKPFLLRSLPHLSSLSLQPPHSLLLPLGSHSDEVFCRLDPYSLRRRLGVNLGLGLES